MECKKMNFFEKKIQEKEKHEKTKIEWEMIVIMQKELLFKQQEEKKRIILIDTISIPQYLIKYYEMRKIKILAK